MDAEIGLSYWRKRQDTSEAAAPWPGHAHVLINAVSAGAVSGAVRSVCVHVRWYSRRNVSSSVPFKCVLVSPVRQ